MATASQYLKYLNDTLSTYAAWVQGRGTAWTRVQSLAQEAASSGWSLNRFLRQIQILKSYQTFLTAPAAEPPAEEPAVTETTTATDEGLMADSAAEDPFAWYSGNDVRSELTSFLREWGLEGLSRFVESAITNHMSVSEIMVKLRDTDVYKTAFPENALRQKNGLSWWSESQILEYRDTARRLAKEYLGVGDLKNDEIATLVAREVSLPEWEKRLQTYKSMLQWGPAVKQALEQELGYQITDDRVFAFMNPDIPTPELDRAYYNALVRGQPAALGLGMRPEEEAQKLREFGFSPEQAFANYQGIAQELPRQERLALIEANLQANGAKLPEIDQMLFGTTSSELFRAFQLKDAGAMEEISKRMAREIARHQSGGGPVRSGTSAVGLLTAGERGR